MKLFRLSKLYSRLIPTLWWILPIVLVPFSLLGVASPYAGIVGLVLMLCATYASYTLVLKERAVPLRHSITLVAAITTCACALLILFLEDLFFQGTLALLLAFAHGYTLLHIRNSLYADEKQLPQLVTESIRLQVLLSVFALSAVSFGVIFYFAVGYGIAVLSIAILASGLLFWKLVSMYGVQFRDRLLVSAVFLIVYIECIIALLWLPVSYMLSGAFLASTFFVYDETVVRFGHKGDMHHHDHKASFLILIGMVVLVIFVSSWK